MARLRVPKVRVAWSRSQTPPQEADSLSHPVLVPRPAGHPSCSGTSLTSCVLCVLPEKRTVAAINLLLFSRPTSASCLSFDSVFHSLPPAQEFPPHKKSLSHSYSQSLQFFFLSPVFLFLLMCLLSVSCCPRRRCCCRRPFADACIIPCLKVLILILCSVFVFPPQRLL